MSTVKVKSEKVKQQQIRAREERTRKAEQQQQQEEENDDAEGEEDNEDDDGSPRQRKRARLSKEGDARNSTPEPEKVIKTLPRDTDGYIPGSIVRIALENFVTYDSVEFCPGPYLNMVLGPNGTGKSSIACAICLGLNWSPSILGRAANIGDFVKNTAKTGWIEIELKARKGQKNLVIRRHLIAGSNSSSFTLNGVQKAGIEITEKMQELNVQVGNLCSFLPQDKVTEFAAMTPIQLLRETQKAAGDPNLTSWHKILIENGKDLKRTEEILAGEKEQIKTMITRNEGLEHDVLRHKERIKIQHDIDLLELLVPAQEYREIVVRFKEAKKRQRMWHTKVAKLKLKNQPTHDHAASLTRDHKALAKERDNNKAATLEKFNQMRDKANSSTELERRSEKLTEQLQTIKKEEKNRAERIKAAEAAVVKLEKTLDQQNQAELESIPELEQKYKSIGEERKQSTASRVAAEEKVAVSADSRAKQVAVVRQLHNELKNLASFEHQKMKRLKEGDRDTADAVEWLRSHKELFEHEVFEPLIISLTVPDSRYTSQVESLINWGQMKTFVTQSAKDSDTFNKHINDNPGLGRRVKINVWFRPKNPLNPPPMSPEQMAENGFSGYALDFVTCPEGMKYYLNSELQFHRTAIGLDPRKTDVNRVMNIVGSAGGAKFVVGTTMNTVGKSAYGRREIYNSTRTINPARNLQATGVDPTAERTLNAKINEADQAMKHIDAEHRKLVEASDAFFNADAAFAKQMTGVRERIKAVKEHGTKLDKLRRQIQKQKENIATMQNEPSSEVKTKLIKEKLLDVTMKRIQIAKAYTDIVRKVVLDQKKSTRAGLEYAQVGANKAALEELCKVKDSKYEAAFAEFQKADGEYNEIKAKSKELVEESRQKATQVDDELQEEFQGINSAHSQYDKELALAEENGTEPPSTEDIDLRTMDELKAALEDAKEALELNIATNPGVMEQYENRKHEIETLQATIDGREAKLARIAKSIQRAKDNWKPALEKLVGSIGKKFSAAFDRIGCAGEIRIGENEEYDQWTIDILVKFRNKEKLQILTSTRQSGGERSLTTILYLMSLTEEARAPFSLVDEINQGMDARAERTVHNSMVDVTCKEDSAQYFLITPKLLPDLEYHERMKVLCVNNGEWLPDEKGLGNMMTMINTFVQQRNRAGNAV